MSRKGNIINNKRLLLLCLILVLVCAGATFAWYVWSGMDIEVAINSTGGDKYINYTVSTISNPVSLVPTNDPLTGGAGTRITITKKAPNLTLYGNLYLKILSADKDAFKSSSLKWVLYKNDNGTRSIVSEGNFVGESVGNLIPMSLNMYIGTDSGVTYEKYIYMDSSVNNNYDISKLSIKTSVVAEGSTINTYDTEYVNSIIYTSSSIDSIGVSSSISNINGYIISNANDEMPTSSTSGWNSISDTLSTTIDVDYTISNTNNYYVCIKNSNNVVVCKYLINSNYLYDTIKRKAVIDNIKSTYVESSSGINFKSLSTDTSNSYNGKGIYIRSGTETNTYPIYYYRGSVTNNNVIFGGICYKIVRTTDTGGIKIIYNGLPSNGECNNTGSSSQIGTSLFNSPTKSPAYSGYMYGDVYSYTSKTMSADYTFASTVTYDTSTSKYVLGTETMTAGASWSSEYNTINNYHYACISKTDCSKVNYIYYTTSTKAYYITLTGGDTADTVISKMLDYNNTDATIKGDNTTSGTIDYWYYNNILTNYNSYLEDIVYCNDRSVYSYGGWNYNGGDTTKKLYYQGYYRIAKSYSPSLSCSRSVDSFSVSSSTGNGMLDYPVGLLTVDEVMLAGGKYNNDNTTFYLYTGSDYWLMTPVLYSSSSSGIGSVSASGKLYYTGSATTALGIRPVISLKSGIVYSSGDGSPTSPYLIYTGD